MTFFKPDAGLMTRYTASTFKSQNGNHYTKGSLINFNIDDKNTIGEFRDQLKFHQGYYIKRQYIPWFLGIMVAVSGW